MISDGKMDLADADAESTCDTLLTLCLDTIAADATGTFLLSGLYVTSGLSPGAEYFASPIAGLITIIRPSNTGQIIRHVGTALNTTVLFFNPSHTYVEYVES